MRLIVVLICTVLGGVIGYLVGQVNGAIIGAIIGLVLGILFVSLPSEIWELLGAVTEFLKCCTIFSAFIVSFVGSSISLLLTQNILFSLFIGLNTFFIWCLMLFLLFWWQTQDQVRPAYAEIRRPAQKK